MRRKKRLTAESLKRVIETQIEPREFAEEMRERGHQGIEIRDVNTSPEATNGYPIICMDCGKTGRMPAPVPEGKVALCPACIRARRG